MRWLNIIYLKHEKFWKRYIFKRRLPGNILLSAYDKPVTITELSVELGVAAVYLEDEIAILEQHDFFGNDYDANRLKWTFANIAIYHAFCKSDACGREKFGAYLQLSNGSSGFVCGYDNNYANHHFIGKLFVFIGVTVIMSTFSVWIMLNIETKQLVC